MENLVIGLVSGLIITALSLKFKFLTKSGALGTLILAVVIFYSGGMKWTVPIVTFFASSSILSKIVLKKTRTTEYITEKNSIRDIYQVMANGLIPFLLATTNIFVKSELLFLMYVSSLAAVCADTWATETGTYFKGKTISILTFKPVVSGISGGISLQGTFGAVCGAILTGLSGMFYTEFSPITFIFVVVISGISGCFADSFAGALLQGLFRCKSCGFVTEKRFHCEEKTELIKGFSFITNETVNFIASIKGAVIALLLIILIQG